MIIKTAPEWGMNRSTGKDLTDLDHLRQSVMDILLTPIGTRILLRDYGSRLSQILDFPMNGQTRIDLIAAAAAALKKWEPRLNILRIKVDFEKAKAVLTVFATLIPSDEHIEIETVFLTGGR